MSDETTPQDSAAMSPASASSQPVAWAVIEWDGDTFGTYRTEEDARNVIEYFSYDGMHAVPLYRHQQPTLTDEEREAIACAAESYADNDDDEDCARIAATLHGLLRRLG